MPTNPDTPFSRADTEQELREEIKRLEGDRDGWMHAYLNKVDVLRVAEEGLSNIVAGYAQMSHDRFHDWSADPVYLAAAEALAKVRETLKP